MNSRLPISRTFLVAIAGIAAMGILLATLTGGCTSTPTAPSGNESFGVRNIALYDGEWKDPQLGVSENQDFSATNDDAIVNDMATSPLDQNKLLVAGNFGYIRSSNSNGIAAGLVLFYLYGGHRALAEGDETDPFYLGGPYNDVEANPNNEDIYFAGSDAEASNLDHGLLGPAAVFDNRLRQWSALHDGTLAGKVRAIERAGNRLYIGGNFQRPFGLANSANLFSYDISDGSIQSMGTGLVGTTSDVIETIETVPDGGVIVGGTFSSIGGVAAQNIARWNGSNWEPLGEGLNGYVHDILSYNGQIYAAGRFYTQDEKFGICARFDGTHWTMLGPTDYDESSVMNQGYALVAYKGSVILGGHFEKIGGVSLHHIAQWDQERNAWIGLEGGGVDVGTNNQEFLAEIHAFAVVADRLYVGGRFDKVRVQ